MTSRQETLPPATNQLLKRKKRRTPVVVCEFHQEVLEYIHRYIAQRYLPFNDIKMIHFDSHPDLAFPHHLQAEHCFDKERMYNDLDIADWILPLVYAGHLKHLIWVKPIWAQQIANMCLKMNVGKEKNTDKLKVDCTEDYFLEDGLYTSTKNLENMKTFQLAVTYLDEIIKRDESNPPNNPTIRRTEPTCKKVAKSLCTERDNEVRSTAKNALQKEARERLDDEYQLTKDNGRTGELHKMVPLIGEDYVLDIDLDYFSVKNPFLKDYTVNEYERLKEIYKIELPTLKEDETVLMSHVDQIRRKLEKLWKTIEDFSNGTALAMDGDVQFLNLLEEIQKRNPDVDWQMVHNAGMTTELPHHVSSEEEIISMLQEFEIFLKTLPPPAVITIARSAEDEYCPPEQVEDIEEKVLCVLKRVFADLDMIFDYKDTSRLI